VYSWSEPATPMPSGYTAPLNTSSTAQTKTGEIGASSFRDADDPDYYMNPSGNSKILGMISSEAGPMENNHLTTKGYVDGLLGNMEQEVSLSNLVYVSGTNPVCPDGTITIMESWVRKADPCRGTDSNCGSYYTCTPPSTWQRPGDPVPSCTYYEGPYGNCAHAKKTCYADTIVEVICAKIGEPLYESRHTVEQCGFWNGEVVSDGTNNFCRFGSSTCPATWTQYENWSTTLPTTAPITMIGTSTYTGSHNWSNTPQESFFCYYGDWASCKKNECAVGYNYGCGGFDVYANMTQIGCY